MGLVSWWWEESGEGSGGMAGSATGHHPSGRRLQACMLLRATACYCTVQVHPGAGCAARGDSTLHGVAIRRRCARSAGAAIRGHAAYIQPHAHYVCVAALTKLSPVLMMTLHPSWPHTESRAEAVAV